MGAFINLIGQRFGRLTVLEQAEPRMEGRRKRTCWLCLCDCGNFTRATSHDLRRGEAQSCGCLRDEHRIAAVKTHGDSHSRLYRIWVDMKRRCLNPRCDAFPLYGGRGIAVCESWKDYGSFQDWALSNGYNDSLTIDRIDPNGNYEPGNCRWASMAVQGNNRRNNVFWEFNGERHTLSEWSVITGINLQTLRGRLIRSGWPIEKALTTPVGGGPV